MYCHDLRRLIGEVDANLCLLLAFTFIFSFIALCVTLASVSGATWTVVEDPIQFQCVVLSHAPWFHSVLFRANPCTVVWQKFICRAQKCPPNMKLTRFQDFGFCVRFSRQSVPQIHELKPPGFDIRCVGFFAPMICWFNQILCMIPV